MEFKKKLIFHLKKKQQATKMVSILFIGDQHFKTDNIKEIDLFIISIEKITIQKKPTIIILAGDLLDSHERLHITPLNKAYELVNKLRILAPVYILVGNHDMCNNQQFLSDNHWMNGMKNWKNTYIIDKVHYETINDFNFTFVPYVFTGRFEEALNTIDEWKSSHCIFAHQEFFGCKMGAIISMEGDKWSLHYPPIVSGHIHLNQTPQKNIYYPGSSLQTSFSDPFNNIVALLSFRSNNDIYELEEIPLCLPKKKIMYIKIEDVNIVQISDLVRDNYKIKLSLSGTVEQFKAFKKTSIYKDITKHQTVKIVFKQNLPDNLSDNIIEHRSFNDVLHQLIVSENNKYLYKIYELIINNKL